MNAKQLLLVSYVLLVFFLFVPLVSGAWRIDSSFKIAFGNGAYLSVNAVLSIDTISYGNNRITFITNTASDTDIYLTSTNDLTLTSFPNATNKWFNYTIGSSGTQTVYYGRPLTVIIDDVERSEGIGWTYNDRLTTVTGALASVYMEFGVGTYVFYGVYDEDTGFLNEPSSRAVNVTAYYEDGTQIEKFEVNGSYTYETSSQPAYFQFDLGNTRQYWLSPSEISANIYIFNTTTTVYTFEFLDLAGALESYPYVTVQRYVNGTLFTVEKRKVDVEDKTQFSLKQGEKYTVIIEDGANYVYGELLMTSDTTVLLTLKGIEFPKETLLTYKYVRIYATRAFGTPNGNITIMYQDTLEMTTSVEILINYKNGSNAYNITLSSDSFIHIWTAALNSTDYAMVVNIVHERYGSYPWKQYFPRHLSDNPWGMDWFGSLPFATNLIIPFFLIIFVGGCFSVINAEVGAFMMVVAAVIVCYMWALPISSSALIVSFTLAILMAIIYAKRKVQT